MDKRILKTRRNIFNVFIQLLEEKKINEITAQEIADLAEISRSTFYLHYTDVYDLLDQAEIEIFNEISELLEGYTYTVIQEDPLRLFTDLFHYFERNSKICVVLINKNGSITTGQRISHMIEEKFQNEWEQLFGQSDRQTVHYLSLYIIAGFVGLLQGWMAGGMEESAGVMAKLARTFIRNSIDQHLETKTEQKEGMKMGILKDQIREDAKGFVGNVLENTSSFLDGKSEEIQRKVESGLGTASSRLAQRSNTVRTGETDAQRLEKELKKLTEKKQELHEKYEEKLKKLTEKGKDNDIVKEQKKYEEDLAKINEKITRAEAAITQHQ